MTSQKTIIVDENDNIIGHKKRGTITSSDIYRVSALRIKNSKGELLLAQRSFNKTNDPGKRGPAVAGTNDEGETYLSNIIKETEEEIGLKDFEILGKRKTRRLGIHNHFTMHYDTVIDKDISEFTIQEDEVEQIRWFNLIELKKQTKENPENFLQGIIDYVEENIKTV